MKTKIKQKTKKQNSKQNKIKNARYQQIIHENDYIIK